MKPTLMTRFMSIEKRTFSQVHKHHLLFFIHYQL